MTEAAVVVVLSELEKDAVTEIMNVGVGRAAGRDRRCDRDRAFFRRTTKTVRAAAASAKTRAA